VLPIRINSVDDQRIELLRSIKTSPSFFGLGLGIDTDLAANTVIRCMQYLGKCSFTEKELLEFFRLRNLADFDFGDLLKRYAPLKHGYRSNTTCALIYKSGIHYEVTLEFLQRCKIAGDRKISCVRDPNAPPPHVWRQS
jgi:hypothetical protein